MSDRLHFVPATERELEALDQHLAAFVVRQTGIDDIRPLGIAIRDEAGRLVGGLKGLTLLGWLYVNVIWLEEDRRGQGSEPNCYAGRNPKPSTADVVPCA